MRKTLVLGFVAGLLLLGAGARATEVGVSIGIQQPGVYGRIDIGRFPMPVLVTPRPVIVQPAPVVFARPDPVYLWVQPEHRRHWHRHCARYGACGQPVLFVQDGWYRQHVAPVRYVERPVERHYRGDDHEHGRGRGQGRGHGERM